MGFKPCTGLRPSLLVRDVARASPTGPWVPPLADSTDWQGPVIERFTRESRALRCQVPEQDKWPIQVVTAWLHQGLAPGRPEEVWAASCCGTRVPERS